MPSTNKIKSCGRRKRLRYFESTTDLIARKLITYGEEFNHNQVHTLLLSLKSRKSLAHSKLRCEPDGIRLKRASKFGPPPPRKFYPYKDIERYYVFDNDPTILILGCVDPEQHSRYYDFFKLPESHYKDITTLINKARSHSDYILNEDDTTLPTPGVYSSHSSLNISNEQLSQNNTSIHETINQTNEVSIDNLQQTINDNITNTSHNNLLINDNHSLEIEQNLDDTIQEQSIDKDDVIIHDHNENHENLYEPEVIKCEFRPCDEPIANIETVGCMKVTSTSSQPNNQKVVQDNSDDNDDDDDDDDDTVEEMMDDQLYCVACDKLFASIKAKLNHESSKKHRKQMEYLQKLIHQEDNILQDHFNSLLFNEQSSNHNNNNEHSNKLTKRAKKAERKRKKELELHNSSNSILNEQQLNSTSDHIEIRNETSSCELDNTTIQSTIENNNNINNNSNKESSIKHSNQSTIKQSEKSISDSSKINKIICDTCFIEFQSRNALFIHLKQSGHAKLKKLNIPSSSSSTTTNNKDPFNENKKKRKERKKSKC